MSTHSLQLLHYPGNYKKGRSNKEPGGHNLQNSVTVRALGKVVNGLALEDELHHGNKNTEPRNTQVSPRANENVLSWSWPEEQFLKN